MTDQVKDTESINNDLSKNSSAGIAAYKPMVKAFAIIVGLWGSVTTATYYIGYSFLQGRTEGLGLGVHELKLSNHEMIRQATLAMFEIRQELLDSLIEAVKMGWFGYLLTGILGAFVIKFFLRQKKGIDTKNESKISRFFATWPRWLKQLAGLPLIAIAITIYFLIFVLALVNTVWTSLEVAHSVGVMRGLNDVAEPVCKKFEAALVTKNFVPGCTQYFDSKGKVYSGKIIISNNEVTIITTNEASYIFDKNRKILSKSKKLK